MAWSPMRVSGVFFLDRRGLRYQLIDSAGKRGFLTLLSSRHRIPPRRGGKNLYSCRSALSTRLRRPIRVGFPRSARPNSFIAGRPASAIRSHLKA